MKEKNELVSTIKLTYDAVGCCVNTEQFKNIDKLHVHYSLQNHHEPQHNRSETNNCKADSCAEDINYKRLQQINILWGAQK